MICFNLALLCPIFVPPIEIEINHEVYQNGRKNNREKEI